MKEFEDTTGFYNYCERDKLLLLKQQQISGRALDLISGLGTNQQTYAGAKNILIAALASTEARKDSII